MKHPEQATGKVRLFKRGAAALFDTMRVSRLHIINSCFRRSPLYAISMLFVPVFLALSGSLTNLQAQPQSNPDPIKALSTGAEPEIYVLNMQVGHFYYNIWGHTALMVNDPDYPEPIVFDYGLFSPDASFAIRFIMGEPTYWMDGTLWRHTRYRYDRENRGIYGQKLRLTSSQKKKLMNHLLNDLKGENRFYHYHHFTNNCTTRVRDLVDFATDGALKRDHMSVEKGETFRKLSMKFGRHMPIYWTIMNLAANERADNPITEWDYMFLPMLFKEKLENWKLESDLPEGGPMIGKVEILTPVGPFVTQEEMDQTLREYFVTLFVLFAVFFLIPALYENRTANILRKIGIYTWSIPGGLTGIIFLIFSMISPRETFQDNYNLFSVSPFLLYQAIHFAFIEKRISLKKNLYIYGFMLILPVTGLLLRITGLTGQELIPGSLYSIGIQVSILAGYYLRKSGRFSGKFFV